MNDEQTDLLVAEFVLGTLDTESRRRFAEELAGNPELQKLVDAWEQRLEGLDDKGEAAALPENLWGRISGALDGDETPASNVTLRASEGEWQLLGEGVEKKPLFTDPTIGCESYLLRLAPGTLLPTHHHKLAEECLMIEGDLSIGDLSLTAGDYHAAQPGSDHPAIFSQHGALLYIRGEVRAA